MYEMTGAMFQDSLASSRRQVMIN